MMNLSHHGTDRRFLRRAQDMAHMKLRSDFYYGRGEMPSTAKYLFIVSMDVEPEHEDLFNEVYDTEHVPNICKVPGVITAYRLKLEEAPLSAGSRASGKSAAP